MPVRYAFDCQSLSTQALETLFAATDLSGRQGDKILRAFRNSSLVCVVYDGERLVAASRAISDFEYHGFIYDVAVMPNYQGQGIGRQMMALLLEKLPVWRVMLRADPDVQGFYRQLGFAIHDDVMALHTKENLFDPTSPAGL